MASLQLPEPASDGARVAAVDLEAVYRFVDLIYEAVEHPGSLEEALTTLADLTEVGSVLLLQVDGDERRLVAAGRSPVRSTNGAAHPVHSRSDQTRTIPLCGGFELVLDRTELSPPVLAALIRLAPHLARAVRLADRLGMAERGNPSRVEALERLPVAALFLDAQGELAFLTRQAREVLARATAIDVEERRVLLRHAVSHAMFEILVERVLATPEATRSFVGGRILVPDGEWPRIDVMVAPYRSLVEKREIRGVVFLSVPGAVKSPEEILMERYALPFEEATVLGDLICGREPAKEDERKRLHAVIHALYQKLGTTRQADLIRMVLRPPGVVFEPDGERTRSA